MRSYGKGILISVQQYNVSTSYAYGRGYACAPYAAFAPKPSL